jgi:hypothetical protein
VFNGRRLLLALVCLVAAYRSASAQELSPLDPPDTARFLKWGPFRVRPGLTIPALGYDDNVFAVTDQTAAANSATKVGDYFIALSPRLEGLVLFGHRAFFTFDERLEFYAYASQTELDYFNQFGRARLTVPFKRFGFYWDTGFDRTRDRPYDRQDIRPIRKYYPLGLGLIAKFGWRSDAELGVFSDRYTVEDPDAVPPPASCVGINCLTVGEVNNRTEEGVRLKARYLAVGRTRFLLELAERQIKFDNPTSALKRDGQERRQLVGVDFGLGGRIYGTFRVGHADFTLADPAATGFNGPVADIAVGYNFGGSGSHLTFTGARDARYTIFDATPLYLYTGGDLSLVKYFNRFIGGEVGAGRAVLRFLGDPQDRVDNDTNFVLGVRFRISENDLGRRVEYAFRYTRWIINSTRDDLDQNRGTVGFGVTFGY